MLPDIFMDPVFRIGIGFVLGAVGGSFLNVCITRIPLGRSVISPPSSCPNCQRPISWSRNIPILTWLSTSGDATCCKYKIPLRYFIIELSAALLFAFLFYRCSSVDEWGLLLCSIFFTSTILAVIAIDFETMMIPDRFSMGGALVGLSFSFFFPVLHGFSLEPVLAERIAALFTGVTGLLISSSLLYWVGALGERLMNKEALGQGDVKLLGLVGVFCGWEGGLFVIFGGALLGTALLLPIMLWDSLSKKKTDQDGNEFGWGVEVPFGPFLGAASLLYFLGFRKAVDTWFEEIITNFIHFFSIV